MNGWTDERIIELIRSKLEVRRFQHSLNVAESARYLAEKYGYDADKAYTAGLLHDVMKNSSPEEQLGVITEAGIELLPEERANKKLWHAIAGAAYIKMVMGIDDKELYRAVRYHTTGRAKMTLLEKIVYLADYISAERSYPGVDDMRRLCDESMDEAILYALEFGIPDLVRRGNVIHPDSVDLYNEVVIKKQRGEEI
ncbi:MAG: bis(5'-nucleosyl)-tetraphosphatase (symmetrical) YqeK [Clostridia bacterium]|nr:bis(5'-nucleosyl)-tetraphosphatase (symmetrical) YqeK [Clostridia bacterium]MBQ3127999.1 bis(5'-nucleosyl)-tetraphosphatase (symmetrical) YqeK [Clostridia bacterium]MBQ7043317.1 bis(5'-nucleosyl)-tetraphosphatase (symmetrical) YqeK [Clostridia bacterium]